MPRKFCLHLQKIAFLKRKGENSQKKYIPRRWDKEVSEFLQDSSANKNVLLVEGARQVGKSSLVCNALANVGGVSYSLNLEQSGRFIRGIKDFPITQ